MTSTTRPRVSSKRRDREDELFTEAHRSHREKHHGEEHEHRPRRSRQRIACAFNPLETSKDLFCTDHVGRGKYFEGVSGMALCTSMWSRRMPGGWSV